MYKEKEPHSNKAQSRENIKLAILCVITGIALELLLNLINNRIAW